METDLCMQSVTHMFQLGTVLRQLSSCGPCILPLLLYPQDQRLQKRSSILRSGVGMGVVPGGTHTRLLTRRCHAHAERKGLRACERPVNHVGRQNRRTRKHKHRLP